MEENNKRLNGEKPIGPSVLERMATIVMKALLSWISVVVTVGCMGYLIWMFWGRWDDVTGALLIYGQQSGLLIAEICLMVANWLIEGLRWHVLRDGDISGDMRTSAQAMAFGNSTPGGVGEHVARTMESKEGKRLRLALSLLASATQTSVISLMGMVSFAVLIVMGESVPEVAFWSAVAVATFAVMAMAVGLLCLKPVRRELMTGLRHTGIGRLVGAAGINAVRVLVFSVQLGLFLKMGELPSLTFMMYILMYYFLLTWCPRMSMLDVGVRCGIGVLVFGGMIDESIIAAGTVSLWAINVVIPTILVLIVSLFKR